MGGMMNRVYKSQTKIYRLALSFEDFTNIWLSLIWKCIKTRFIKFSIIWKIVIQMNAFARSKKNTKI